MTGQREFYVPIFATVAVNRHKQLALLFHRPHDASVGLCKGRRGQGGAVLVPRVRSADSRRVRHGAGSVRGAFVRRRAFVGRACARVGRARVRQRRRAVAAVGHRRVDDERVEEIVHRRKNTS